MTPSAPLFCPHGETEQHGEMGKDWCPGPLSKTLELWRSQMEFQVNAPLLIGIEQPYREPGELRVNRLTDAELHVVQAVTDSLKNFKPIGWSSSWGERWYDVPIYNSVVDDLGFDPLFRK